MNVVITGASRGIGFAIAEIFAAQGHDLLLVSKNDINLYKAVERLLTKYPSVTIKAKPFDLGKRTGTVACAKWILGIGTPDILVNNAGTFEPGTVHNEPEGLLESQIENNLYSAYHLTRELLPSMMKPVASTQNRHIFNMCSIASLGAYPNGGSYSISKYALHGFSKNLREELKTHRIKVTAVFPGAVMTGSWEGFDNSTHRIMEAEDVAKMIHAASQLSFAACVEDIILRPQLGDL